MGGILSTGAGASEIPTAGGRILPVWDLSYRYVFQMLCINVIYIYMQLNIRIFVYLAKKTAKKYHLSHRESCKRLHPMPPWSCPHLCTVHIPPQSHPSTSLHIPPPPSPPPPPSRTDQWDATLAGSLGENRPRSVGSARPRGTRWEPGGAVMNTAANNKIRSVDHGRKESGIQPKWSDWGRLCAGPGRVGIALKHPSADETSVFFNDRYFCSQDVSFENEEQWQRNRVCLSVCMSVKTQIIVTSSLG